MSAHHGDSSLSMRLFCEVVRQGWTLQDAAERTGLSVGRLSELFWNLRPPEPQELKRLAEALVAQTASAEDAQTNVVHQPEQDPTAAADPATQTMLAQMTAMLEAMSRTSGNGDKASLG